MKVIKVVGIVLDVLTVPLDLLIFVQVDVAHYSRRILVLWTR